MTYTIPISIQRLVCSGCGAEANASCNCYKVYLPKSERAAAAIKAHPEKSSRAIAAEIGVSPATVDRVRASHEAPAAETPASHEAPATITGKDRKKYPKPRPKPSSRKMLKADLKHARTENDQLRSTLALNALNAKVPPEQIAEFIYERLGHEKADLVCTALLTVISKARSKQMTMIVPNYLQTVFTNPQWRRIRERIYYGEFDGTKNGVVVATMSPNRDNYALNCAEHERVRTAKLSGKVDLAFVVAARLTEFGKPPEYLCGNFIEAVSTIGLRKMVGRFGDFWVLQPEDVDPNAPL